MQSSPSASKVRPSEKAGSVCHSNSWRSIRKVVISEDVQLAIDAVGEAHRQAPTQYVASFAVSFQYMRWQAIASRGAYEVVYLRDGDRPS